MQLKKNDTVLVRSGEDRGKKGRVLKVFGDDHRAIVEGINFVKRHLKKGHPEAKEGGIVSKEAPIQISNLMVICTVCQKPTRIRRKELADGRRVRMCAKCGESVEKV